MINMDTYLVTKKEKCTGCGVCINICPAEAVYMDVDTEGFWYPVIDKKKCIKCDKCVYICPVLKEKKSDNRGAELEFQSKVKIYAAWSLDHEIRYNSTSGGIFSELALSVLAEGGYICGAVYDKQQMVRHFISNKRQDILRLRQSKYVQSDMGYTYKKIGDLLKKGEVLLFCGTPCQCKGVANYCREKLIDTTNLYLIDFICRGSNSPKVYKKFLEELELKYKADVNKVWFKNKTYGWNRFSTKIEFKNGRYYLKDRYHDTYIRGYIEENLYIRPACTNCEFKGFHREADLTLADFWGIQIEEHMKDIDDGTSLVMVYTVKGKKLWESITPRIFQTEKKIEDVIQGNVCFEHSVQHGEHREQFMKDLDSLPVIDNIERFLKEKQGKQRYERSEPREVN